MFIDFFDSGKLNYIKFLFSVVIVPRFRLLACSFCSLSGHSYFMSQLALFDGKNLWFRYVIGELMCNIRLLEFLDVNSDVEMLRWIFLQRITVL